METPEQLTTDQIFAERALEAFQGLREKIDNIYVLAAEQIKGARFDASESPRYAFHVEGNKVSFTYRDLYFEFEGFRHFYRINSKDSNPTVDPKTLEIVTNTLSKEDVVGEYIKILHSLVDKQNGQETTINTI